jgi:hypothetical protein
VAEARLATIQNGSHDAQVKATGAQVTASRERLKMDQAHLDQLLGGPTEEDLTQAEALVDQARQQLALAQQPSTDQDLRSLRRRRPAQIQPRLEPTAQPV